jgi:hypothetical protein
LREFLEHIAPELAALLRVTADYLDPGVEYGPDPEGEPMVTKPTELFRVDDRGGIVPVESGG